jgi:hypothetical protein
MCGETGSCSPEPEPKDLWHSAVLRQNVAGHAGDRLFAKGVRQSGLVDELATGHIIYYAWVRRDAVRSAEALPSAMEETILGDKNARTAKRRTCRSPRFSAPAISSKDDALPVIIASIQRRARAIVCNRWSRDAESIEFFSVGEWMTPFLGERFGVKGMRRGPLCCLLVPHHCQRV